MSFILFFVLLGFALYHKFEWATAVAMLMILWAFAIGRPGWQIFLAIALAITCYILSITLKGKPEHVEKKAALDKEAKRLGVGFKSIMAAFRNAWNIWFAEEPEEKEAAAQQISEADKEIESVGEAAEDPRVIRI